MINSKCMSLLAVLFLAASCEKSDQTNGADDFVAMREISISASMNNPTSASSQTKITSTEDDAASVTYAWESTDELLGWVADLNGSGKYFSSEAESSKFTVTNLNFGSFEGSVPVVDESSQKGIRFLFPYDLNANIVHGDNGSSSDCYFELDLSEQTYDNNLKYYPAYLMSEEPIALTSIGADATTISMKHLVAYVKLSMTFNVDNVSLKSIIISKGSEGGDNIISKGNIPYNFADFSNSDEPVSPTAGDINITVENMDNLQSGNNYIVRAAIHPYNIPDDGNKDIQFTFVVNDGTKDVSINKTITLGDNSSLQLSRSEVQPFTFVDIEIPSQNEEIPTVAANSTGLTDNYDKSTITAEDGTLAQLLKDKFVDKYDDNALYNVNDIDPVNAATEAAAKVSETPIDAVKVTGNINAADFLALRGRFKKIDLSGATIVGSAYYNTSTKDGTSTDGYRTSSLPSKAFMGDTVLEELILPSGVKTMGYNVFRASGLKTITIPASMTEIPFGAFHTCILLTSVAFEDNSLLTNIGGSSFNGCSALTSISLPSSITAINASAFAGCSTMTSITFAEGTNKLTTIGDTAFNNCKKLSAINIPASVTTLGSTPFSGCIALTQITVNWAEEATVKEIADATSSTPTFPAQFAEGDTSEATINDTNGYFTENNWGYKIYRIQ